MRFSNGSNRKSTAINITSLIDVMFLLVIFVLLAAKFEPDGGIAVDLPTARSEESPGTPEVFILTITHDGEYYLQKDRVAEPELGAAIAAMREGHTDPVMVISADRNAPTRHLIHATDIARQVGQARVHFKTKP